MAGTRPSGIGNGRSRARRWRLGLALAGTCLAGLSGSAACSSGNDGAVTSAPPLRCGAEEKRVCLGLDGCDGEQRCLSDRSDFGECGCLADTSAAGGAGGAGAGGLGGAAGGLGGAAGDAGGACTATCDPSELVLCQEGARTFCAAFATECPEPSIIACQSGFCADELSCGSCPQQCAQAGEMGCAKGALRECETDARGCLAWGEAQSDCASGFCAADAASCGVCVNACPTAGVAECKAGQLRSCNVDPFGCLSWWSWSACALGACADATHCQSGYSEGQRGTPLDDEPLALAIDRLGALVMVGGYHNYDLATAYRQEFDAHLHVAGPDGALKVFETWGSKEQPDEALAVAVAGDNSYVIVGFTEGAVGAGPNHGGRDAFLAKWSPAQPTKKHALLFSRQWGSAEDDAAVSVGLDRDATAYVLGTTRGALRSDATPEEQDLFLSRWDSAGNFIETFQWGTSALDEARSVLLDAKDGVIVAGSTRGAWPNNTNAGLGDAFVSRLNSDGTIAWTTQFGTAGDDQVAQMSFDRQGNLLVLGTTDGVFPGNTSAGQSDVFLSKLDANGGLLFSRQWGTPAKDTAASLAQAPNGEIYAAITVADAEQGCALGQALLLRWNASATQATPRLFDTCEEDRATAVTVDPNGTVYLAGATKGSFVDLVGRGGTDIFSIVVQIAN